MVLWNKGAGARQCSGIPIIPIELDQPWAWLPALFLSVIIVRLIDQRQEINRLRFENAHFVL